MRPGLLVGVRPFARRFSALLVGAGLLVGVVSGVAAAQDGDGAGPLVDIVELEGVVDATMAGYLERVIARANADGAEVVVVQVDSPGGLNVSAQRLAAAVGDSGVPVVAWVGPPGAQARSAARVVAQAADLLAVAPGTVLGAAEPVDLADADAAGPPAEVAVTLPDGTVPAGGADGVVVSAEEALDRGAAAFVASTLPDVLRELDGRAVGPGGAGLDIDPVAADVRFNNPGLLARTLHAVATPALAYLLVVGGALTLAFEVFQPGFGVAGVAGVLLAALGIFGLVVLPVSWLAFAALVAGIALLGLDLALGRLGALTAAGAVAVGAGSWWLFTGPDLLRVPSWVIAGVTIFSVVYFVGILTPVLRAQGTQAAAGAQRVVGQTGVVRSVLNPEGHVFVDGALWRARAPEDAGKVRTGTVVRVVGLDDRLTLEVRVAEPDRAQPTAARS